MAVKRKIHSKYVLKKKQKKLQATLIKGAWVTILILSIALNYLNTSVLPISKENHIHYLDLKQTAFLSIPDNTKDFKDEKENTIISIPSETIKYIEIDESEEMETVDKSNDIIPYRGTIALTYDDGPHSQLTPALLEILRDNGVKATFFVLGLRIKANSNVIKQMHVEGHEIGIHGYSHTSFFDLSITQLKNEIQTTSDYIYGITDLRPTLVRPPYGHISINIAHNIDKPIINWSIDSNDWRRISNEKVINDVLTNLSDGRIILFHDVYQRTIEVNKILIPKIKELGYDIVTVSELFELEGISLENGRIYSRTKK